MEARLLLLSRRRPVSAATRAAPPAAPRPTPTFRIGFKGRGEKRVRSRHPSSPEWTSPGASPSGRGPSRRWRTPRSMGCRVGGRARSRSRRSSRRCAARVYQTDQPLAKTAATAIQNVAISGLSHAPNMLREDTCPGRAQRARLSVGPPAAARSGRGTNRRRHRLRAPHSWATGG
jgi:hypothetical protein